ncbi:MAG: GNAT family N-acetyltransferase [Deferribacterales bacterium]
MRLKGDGIILVSFGEYERSEEVRKTYLSWLEDLEVTGLIASESLLMPKNMQFIDDSFVRFQSKSCIGFFIQDFETGELIGTAKLDKINHYTKSAEDGIMIGNRNFWGKGVAKKVYKVILDYAFGTLGLNRITSGCNEHNTGMVKVLEYFGYKQEGVLRESDYINGTYSNHLLFGILRSEYKGDIG